MNRLHCIGTVVFGILLAIGVAEAGDTKSESKVKASIEASKIDAKGLQTVIITLDVVKGWHLYANPVNHEFLEGAQTKIKKATAKGKVTIVDVKYPRGKTVVDKKEMYDIYEGVVKIEATLKRAADDTSPVEVSVAIQACDKSVCLQQGTLKLIAK